MISPLWNIKEDTNLTGVTPYSSRLHVGIFIVHVVHYLWKHCYTIDNCISALCLNFSVWEGHTVRVLALSAGRVWGTIRYAGE